MAYQRFVITTLALILAFIPDQSFGLEISASVDAKQVWLQQPFTWRVEVKDSDEMPQVRLPDIENLAVLSGPMQSSNYSWTNGKAESNKSVSYTFVGLEPGRVTIPPVEVIIGNKVYLTKAISVDILEEPRQKKKPVRKAGKQPSIYLKAEPSRTSVYWGEPVTVQYKLYTQVNVYKYQVDKLPDAVGFWTDEVEQKRQPRLVSEVVDGVRYNTAILKTVVYYPTRTGELIIDPMKADLEIEVKSTQRRRSLFNDPFFNDPFFNGTQRAQKILTSNPLLIDVIPLPEPKPQGYSGGVGSFKLQMELDTTAVRINDAVGLKIILSGSGNFKSIKVPMPVMPDGIEVFKPESTEKIELKNFMHTGNKTVTHLLVPRRSGNILIPALSFTYFDPKTRTYRTAKTRDLRLKVAELSGEMPIITSGYSREEVELIQDDIRYIKKASSSFKPIQASYKLGTLFWFIHLLGLIAVVGIIVYDYQKKQLNADKALLRRSKALSIARRNLKKASQNTDSVVLQSLMHQIIIKFIGDMLNLSENALETDELLDALETSGINSFLLTKTKKFLDKLSQDRFAPGVQSMDSKELIDRTTHLLNELSKELG